MKIMHFIHGLNTGGAETLVKNYMLTFDYNKNDYVLLCLYRYRKSPYENELKNNGIRVIYVEDYLPFSINSNVFAKVINRFYRYAVVRKIIRDESPDVLHTHLQVNALVKFARPKKSTAIIHTIHADPEKLYFVNKKGQRQDYRSIKWLVKKYKMRFIVLHEKMRKEVNFLFGVNNTVILNNGIDLSKYNAVKDIPSLRRNFKIPEESFVVGHIGRFADAKNQEFLVDLFKELKEPNKFLLMIGDGEDEEKIMKKLDDYELNDRYKILSNRKDVPDLLCMMNIFVFPSKYEGLGIALIEAQESKLPCFISDKVPKYATISNLVTELPLDDIDKWVDVIEHYKKPEKIIINDENWDVRKIVKQLEKIYEEAVRERRNGKK